MSAPTQGFLPGRYPIDAVGEGGFRFADMSHRGSLLILPSGFHAWPITTIEDIKPSSFHPLFAEAKKIDFVLIGTGEKIIRLAEPLLWRFREFSFQFDMMSTVAAARTYNVLVAEHRRVAAALIAI
jgi:uncharacterized protein